MIYLQHEVDFSFIITEFGIIHNIFYHIVLHMLLNHRKKQVYEDQILQKNPTNHSIDDSLVESNTSKRFMRKKGCVNSQLRSTRTIKNCFDTAKGEQHNQKIIQSSHPGNRTKQNELDLSLNFNQNSTRAKIYFPLASTDRKTESTNLKQSSFTQSFTLTSFPFSSQNEIPSLREELLVRNRQMAEIQNEMMKLKRELQSKDEQNLKDRIRREREHNKQIETLKKQIIILRRQLTQQSYINKQNINANMAINQQINELKNHNIALQKIAQELIANKLPNQMRQLMSIREISLIRQIKNLKKLLNQDKSMRQLQLEAQLKAANEQRKINLDALMKFDIASRFTSRKLKDLQQLFRQEKQKFANRLKQLVHSNEQLKIQLKKIRKENIKMSLLNSLGHRNIPAKNKCPSVLDDSLSLSSSSQN